MVVNGGHFGLSLRPPSALASYLHLAPAVEPVAAPGKLSIPRRFR